MIRAYSRRLPGPRLSSSSWSAEPLATNSSRGRPPPWPYHHTSSSKLVTPIASPTAKLSPPAPSAGVIVLALEVFFCIGHVGNLVHRGLDRLTAVDAGLGRIAPVSVDFIVKIHRTRRKGRAELLHFTCRVRSLG